MHAVALLCINHYTKFEVPSFTHYKDMIGAKFRKMGHVTDLASVRGGLSP